MINTGVPTNLNRPQTFHTFTYLKANRSLVSLPLRAALVGMKSAAGTAVNGTVYEIVDATQTDGLFGIGSELALMCRMAFALTAYLTRGPRLYAVSIAEPGASVAAQRTATVAGPATADGNAVMRLAGRTAVIGIANGDSANTIATKISNAFKALDENLPCSVSVAANVVTFVYRTTGVNGNDVKLVVDQSVAGVTITPANSVVGTGAASIQPAIDALAAGKYDGIAIGNHAAADITIISTDIAARWGAADKGWRYYYVGETGTIGTATALAAAANHQAGIIGSYENCPNLCGELAVFDCIAVNSRERPNAVYNSLRGPLFPPPLADAYTPAELETAIAAGLTPHEPVLASNGAIVDGFSKITRLVTSKTTSGGQPFDTLRDIAVSRTGVALARQLDAESEARFGADANPDGTLQTDATIDQVGDIARVVMRAYGESNVLRNVEQDLKKFLAERDQVVGGRTNADLWYTVVLGQHQIAWKHNVQS